LVAALATPLALATTLLLTVTLPYCMNGSPPNCSGRGCGSLYHKCVAMNRRAARQSKRLPLPPRSRQTRHRRRARELAGGGPSECHRLPPGRLSVMLRDH
jgi:hypothetical protein